MKYIKVLAMILIVAFVGCSEDQTFTNVQPVDDTPEHTEQWVITFADGTSQTVYSEADAWDVVEANEKPERMRNGFIGPQSECWHWTWDEGTWWVRHCGYTLSQECYYFSGPTGELRDCDEVGGGPGGNW